MVEVAWTDEVIDQLDRIVSYIELFDPAAAIRLKDRLIELGNSLSEFPNRGRPSSNGTRELTTVPPYILQYDVTGQMVTIVSIRHGARRPADA